MVSVSLFAIGIAHISKEQGVDVTSFGHHTLELGSKHKMINI